MMRRRSTATKLAAASISLVFVAAACGDGGGDGEPLEPAEAVERLDELADDIDWVDNPVTRSASIPPPSGADLSSTLPPIDEFEIVVDSPLPSAVEIWASTEKSGDGTDAWMTEVADAFNREGLTLSDGSQAGVDLRRIASGTGYQYIARGDELPDAFSPSNELWIEMAGEFQTMTEVSPSMVPNVAGIVMKNETADELRSNYGELTPENLVDAVIAGELVMGYTNPFASSTGLNFLLTVLDSIAGGDE
jgi:Ca-activated chloride channel family protein